MQVEFSIVANDLDQAERVANALLIGHPDLKISKPKLMSKPARITNPHSGEPENQYAFSVETSAKDLADFHLRKWLDYCEGMGAKLVSPKFTMTLGIERMKELGLDEPNESPVYEMSLARETELGIAEPAQPQKPTMTLQDYERLGIDPPARLTASH